MFMLKPHQQILPFSFFVHQQVFDNQLLSVLRPSILSLPDSACFAASKSETYLNLLTTVTAHFNVMETRAERPEESASTTG